MKVLSGVNISDIKAKVPKLYEQYGTNTDGAVTQNFIDTKLNSTSISLGRGAKSISSGSDTSINIGINATSYGYSLTSNVAIGNGARVGSNDQPVVESIAIGRGAVVEKNGGVAIGAISKCTELNTVSFGGILEGQTLLRRLCYVDTGIADTDAVNVKQMQDYVAEHAGTPEGYDTLKTKVDGLANVKTIDTSLSLSDEGELSTNLYSDWGNNENGSLTQKFLNSKLNATNIVKLGNPTYLEDGITSGIGIKGYIGAQDGIAIGGGVMGQRGIGIGGSCMNKMSVTIGADSGDSREYEVSIGWDVQNTGYPNGLTRYLANVRDGEKPHDAVNLKQLNEAVGNIEEALKQINGSVQPTLTNLKMAVQNGTAQSLFPVGTEIEDTYEDKSSPWIVTDYSNEIPSVSGTNIVETPTNTHEGVILMRKNVVSVGSMTTGLAGLQGSNSSLASVLSDTFTSCSAELKSTMLSNFSNIYESMDDNSQFYKNINGLSIPSAIQIGGIAGTSHSTKIWEYFSDKISAPTNNADNSRIATIEAGQTVAYNLSTLYDITSSYQVGETGNIGADIAPSAGIRQVVAIVKE